MYHLFKSLAALKFTISEACMLRGRHTKGKGSRMRVVGWCGVGGWAEFGVRVYATTENGRLHLQSSGITYILNGKEWFAKWEDDTVVPMSKDRTASRGSINRAIC